MSTRNLSVVVFFAFAMTAMTGLVGCEKQGEMLRTPEQWRAEVAALFEPLIPELRDCYVKSKASWAAFAKGEGNNPASIATMMKPKPRETIILYISVSSASDVPMFKVDQGYDDAVPAGEHTHAADLQKCVEETLSKIKTPPPKTDTNAGSGTWHVVFVPEPAGASPAPPPTTTTPATTTTMPHS